MLITENTENELLVRPPPPSPRLKLCTAHNCTFSTKLEMKTEITWSLD